MSPTSYQAAPPRNGPLIILRIPEIARQNLLNRFSADAALYLTYILGILRTMGKMMYVISCSGPQGMLVVKTSGEMNGGDFVAMAKDLLVHPERKKLGGVLFDHRDLDFSDVGIDDLEAIRSFHRAHEDDIGNGKSAILVGRGMAEKWHKLWSQGQKIKTGNVVRVFEDHDEAVAWIR